MWGKPRLLLLVASVVVHACVLLAVQAQRGGADAFAFNSLDSREYYRIARNLAEHGAFSQSVSPPFEPDTWRTPGYPLFLTALMRVVGKSPLMIVVVQQLLSILNVLLLFGTAQGCMSERRAAVVALLFLVEPYHLFDSLWLMPTTLFVTILLLTWSAWQIADRTGRWVWFATAGVLCGALVLTRPVAVLVPFVLLAALAGRGRATRYADAGAAWAAQRWKPPIIFAACAMVMVGVWMGRNRVVAGHLALSDQRGVVLAYFKASEAVLWREGRAAERFRETSLNPADANHPHTVWDRIDRRLHDAFFDLDDTRRTQLHWRNLAQGNKTDVDSFEVSRVLSRIGWSLLAESLVSSAMCYLVRCGSILTFPLNLAIRPAVGAEGGRLRRGAVGVAYLLLCLAVLARWLRGLVLAGSELKDSGPVFKNHVSRLSTAATGSGRGFAQRMTGRAIFPLACAAALLLATTPQMDPRFRVPLIPLLLFLALLPAAAGPPDQPGAAAL